MKKFTIIMAMAAVLPAAGVVFGRCASADSTAQRETPARSATAQENAGLAIRHTESLIILAPVTRLQYPSINGLYIILYSV